MLSPLTVVLVEDHISAREELEILLTRQGWEVCGVETGDELSQLLRKQSFNIAVLDVNLPGEDGYSIARRIAQSHPNMGRIILTGLTRAADRTTGYESGADVYLAKPVHHEELIAAIRNLATRLTPPKASGLILNHAQRLISSEGRPGCKLSQQEARLLELLMLQPNREASFDQIGEELGMRSGAPMSRDNVAVIVSRLRSKVEGCSGVENLISAIRGHGYRLNVPLVLE